MSNNTGEFTLTKLPTMPLQEPKLPATFNVGASVRHKASQGVYIITIGPDKGVLEKTGEPAYGYTDGKKIFFRSQEEMEDGRFEHYDAPCHPIAH